MKFSPQKTWFSSDSNMIGTHTFLSRVVKKIIYKPAIKRHKTTVLTRTRPLVTLSKNSDK